MPEYLSPGVYVEEIETGPVPIEGVSTSTAGFVGQTERGPTQPMLVTSFIDYQRSYGGFIDTTVSFLPFAIKGFFDNGGQRAFIARVVGAGAQAANLAVGAAANLILEAIGPGAFGNRLFVRVLPSTLQTGGNPVGFRLTLLYYQSMPPLPLVDPTNPANIRNANRREPTAVEDYDNLRIDPNSSDYVLTVVNGASQLAHIPPPAAPIATPPPAAFT